jgi:hypothetical protein
VLLGWTIPKSFIKRLNAGSFRAFQDSGWQNDCLIHTCWADDKVKTSYYYFGGGVKFETSSVENEDIFPLVLLTVSSLAKCSVQLCITYWFHRGFLHLILSEPDRCNVCTPSYIINYKLWWSDLFSSSKSISTDIPSVLYLSDIKHMQGKFG